jgi:hypothetical protein
MLKRSLIFVLAVGASFVVAWPVVRLVLDADLHLKKANAATSTDERSKAATLEPFKMAPAANQTTMRMLAMDQGEHPAFWALVLKSKKKICDVVIRTMYQGGSESGGDNWSIGCRDGNKYSINIKPNAQSSACTQNSFAGRAE